MILKANFILKNHFFSHQYHIFPFEIQYPSHYENPIKKKAADSLSQQLEILASEYEFSLVEMRRIELLSKQSPTRQRLQLFPSSYPKVLDGNKNSFGLAIVDSK